VTGARLARTAPVAACLAVSAAGGWWWAQAQERDVTVAGPEAVEVEATSQYSFASVGAMAASSDVVIVGTVVSVADGRVLGDPGGAAVRTQLAVVEVERTLVGPDLASVVVEEEAELADGRPITVNGVAPAGVGDRALWFLQAVPGDSRTFIVINSQGRFTDADGHVAAGDVDDPLVAALVGIEFDDLVTAVAVAVP
jgi:hypothetical protein